MKEKILENKHIYLCFLVLTFLLYGNTLKNKYSLDDEYVTITNFPVKGKEYIPNNKLIEKGFAGIPKIWRSRYAHDADFTFDYRPVVTTTFAIEYGLFGQNPFVSHLINLLLYFILICLLFNTLSDIFRDHKQKMLFSFLPSLLFLIHPIHTEVVASLKCRDEILAFLFSLIALKYALLFYEKPSFKLAFIIFLTLFLGFFSKLSAVLIMFSIPLVILFYRKTDIKKLVFMSIGLYIAYIGFQEFTDTMPTEENVRFFYHFENPLATEEVSFLQKLIIGIKTFGFYIQMLFFPYPLRFYYGSNMFDMSPGINSYFITGIAFIALCAIYYFKKRDKDFLFSFLFFCMLILPFLNFITPVAGILGERLAFIASIGFTLLLTISIKNLFPSFLYTGFSSLFKKPLSYMAPIVFICLIYVINRNNKWYNKLTLFEHDMPYVKNSAKANSLMGNEYFEMLSSPIPKYPISLLIEKGIKHYDLAVKNDSSFFTAYNNAGVIYYSYKGDFKTAKKYFTLAVNHRKNYTQAYENLGNCYKQENNIPMAVENYKKAILSKPYEFQSYNALVNLFFDGKQYAKCIQFIKIFEAVFPNNYYLILKEANCYFLLGETEKAMKKYDAAYKIMPNQELSDFIQQQALKMNNTPVNKK